MSCIAGKVLCAMDLGQFKLTEVIAEMTVAEKFVAAKFFDASGYWPTELDNGAFTEGKMDQELLEFLIDVHPSVLANPSVFLGKYLDKSQKYFEYCLKWLEEMSKPSNNPETRDEINSFIAELETVGGSEERFPVLLKAAKDARSKWRVTPSPKNHREASIDAANTWSILGEKTRNLAFVRAALVRERSHSVSSTPSNVSSPTPQPRSMTPGLAQFPVSSASAVREPLRRQNSQSSATPRGVATPRGIATPRSAVASSGSSRPSPAPRTQTQLQSIDIGDMELAVGKSEGIYGWVLDKSTGAFIGKLDEAAGDIFRGDMIVSENFLERIVPLTPAEIARIEKVGRKYVPYVHTAHL